MSLLGFSLQNETLILDDFFYLYSVNAARLSDFYESFVGAREALKKTEKDITRPCEQGNWDTWMVLDPWNQV